MCKGKDSSDDLPNTPNIPDLDLTKYGDRWEEIAERSDAIFDHRLEQSNHTYELMAGRIKEQLNLLDNSGEAADSYMRDIMRSSGEQFAAMREQRASMAQSYGVMRDQLGMQRQSNQDMRRSYQNEQRSYDEMGRQLKDQDQSYDEMGRQLKGAEEFYDQSGDWLGQARQQDARADEMLGRSDQQYQQMERDLTATQGQRQALDAQFQPVDDKLVSTALGYDTQARRDQEAASAVSEARQQVAAGQNRARANLESYGIDPSQMRYRALDRQAELDAARLGVQGADAARDQVETRGQELIGQAAGLRGVRTQSSQQDQQLALARGEIAQGQGALAQAQGGRANQTAGVGVNLGQLGVSRGNLGLGFGGLGVNQGQLGLGFGGLGVNQGQLGVAQGNLGVAQGALGAQYGNLAVNQGQLANQTGALGVSQQNAAANFGQLAQSGMQAGIQGAIGLGGLEQRMRGNPLDYARMNAGALAEAQDTFLTQYRQNAANQWQNYEAHRQKAELRRAEGQSNAAGIGSMVGTLGGAAIGGYFGGTAGARVGAQAGGQAGGALPGLY
jgi:hypothetical protein